MKDAEDEAFDELARKQGAWGGGFQAKRRMAADKLQDGKCKYCVDGCAACDARAQPAQEPYDQTALELCNVCGWKTLIPDDGCLNCERAQPAQEPWNEDEWRRNNWRCQHGWLRGEQCEICNAPLAPQRTWVGLTDAEIGKQTILAGFNPEWKIEIGMVFSIVRNLEAKLKEKNA